MKQYELSVLLHPDLEMDLEKTLTKIKKIIADHGGKITKEEKAGKKRLSYPIAKQNFAVYLFFEIDLPAESASKLDSILNITDEVIRHLLVSVDPKAKAYLAEAKKHGDKSEDEEGEE